jgi:hypothetical protein
MLKHLALAKPRPQMSSRRKRTLRLSRETVRTLTHDELSLAAGGSCPKGSWPNTQNTARTAQGC